MTRISHQSLRVMWLILLSTFTLFLLAAEAASAPPDHMMQDGKPLRQR